MNLKRKQEAYYSRRDYRILSEYPHLRRSSINNDKRYKSYISPPKYAPYNYFLWTKSHKQRYRGEEYLLSQRNCYEEDSVISYLMQLWKSIAPDIESDVGKEYVLEILEKADNNEEAVSFIKRHFEDFNPEEHKTFLLKMSMLKKSR